LWGRVVNIVTRQAKHYGFKVLTASRVHTRNEGDYGPLPNREVGLGVQDSVTRGEGNEGTVPKSGQGKKHACSTGQSRGQRDHVQPPSYSAQGF